MQGGGRTTPQFTVNVPVVGNTWAVGIAFQTHLVVVAFVIGIAILAPVAEMLGLRAGAGHWSRLARELASTTVKLFSFGATWAVLGLVLLFSLYPRLFGTLTSIFFGPLIAVSVIWFVMTVSAYLYYHTWDSLRGRRPLHIAIGWLFAIATLLFIALITNLSSFQLTPTNPTSLAAAVFNPSWLTELAHRDIGNLSYAGLILAGYSGVRGLFFRRVSETDRAYLDWLGDTGILLGVGFLLLQPFAGWLYAHQIQAASPDAFKRMMQGDNGWMFLVQQFFFGIALLLGNLYMFLARRRAGSDGRGRSWMRLSIWLILILALLAIVPREWPLGQMSPWKYLSLGGGILLTAINLVLYLGSRGRFAWGMAGAGAQAALAATAVTIALLMITMGTIRESSRGGDLIYHRLGSDQAETLDTGQ